LGYRVALCPRISAALTPTHPSSTRHRRPPPPHLQFGTAVAADPTIIYTKTDEAPALATYSFLPIVQVRLLPTSPQPVSPSISCDCKHQHNTLTAHTPFLPRTHQKPHNPHTRRPQAFTSSSGVSVETRDISVANRILAAFPESLTPDQQVHPSFIASCFGSRYDG
jgi:hypothetical protein